MNCASKFSSYVTMIYLCYNELLDELFTMSYLTMICSYFFIIIINEVSTNTTSVTRLKLFFFFFFANDQIFVKVFFHYCFTVFKLFRDRFNKFKSSIFASKSNYWLTKFIINTNNFVRKTTRNVILMFFLIRTFIIFNILQITLKISINFKWN